MMLELKKISQNLIIAITFIFFFGQSNKLSGQSAFEETLNNVQQFCEESSLEHDSYKKMFLQSSIIRAKSLYKQLSEVTGICQQFLELSDEFTLLKHIKILQQHHMRNLRQALDRFYDCSIGEVSDEDSHKVFHFYQLLNQIFTDKNAKKHSTLQAVFDALVRRPLDNPVLTVTCLIGASFLAYTLHRWAKAKIFTEGPILNSDDHEYLEKLLHSLSDNGHVCIGIKGNLDSLKVKFQNALDKWTELRKKVKGTPTLKEFQQNAENKHMINIILKQHITGSPIHADRIIFWYNNKWLLWGNKPSSQVIGLANTTETKIFPLPSKSIKESSNLLRQIRTLKEMNLAGGILDSAWEIANLS